MYGLTRIQNDCFNFLLSHKGEKGVYPSIREISDHLGLKSAGRAHSILGGLEERGVIKRMSHKPRAIEIIAPHEARTVLVNAELWAPLVRYVIAEQCTIEVAVNAFIRDGLEGA